MEEAGAIIDKAAAAPPATDTPAAPAPAQSDAVDKSEGDKSDSKKKTLTQKRVPAVMGKGRPKKAVKKDESASDLAAITALLLSYLPKHTHIGFSHDNVAALITSIDRSQDRSMYTNMGKLEREDARQVCIGCRRVNVCA